MVVSTRKRAAAEAVQPAARATPKRLKAGGSPAAAGGSTPQARGLHGSPATTPAKNTGTSVPKKGGSAVGSFDGLHMPRGTPLPPCPPTEARGSANRAALTSLAQAAVVPPS